MGDFDAAVEALSPLATPMEVQGLFCGVYCVSKATPTQAHWHEMLRTHFGDEAPLVDAVDAIAGAQGQALADENLSFQLWLPDDEAPLGDRADGLARFCGAFLSGYGLSGGQLDAADREAMEDLAAIAQLSDQLDDDEENAQNLEMLIEHVRVVVLNLAEPGATA